MKFTERKYNLWNYNKPSQLLRRVACEYEAKSLEILHEEIARSKNVSKG